MADATPARPSLDQALTAADLGRGTRDDPRLVVEVWLRLRGARRLLMLRRSQARGGFWQGVSGRVEAHDGTLRQAALREVREETGRVSGPDDLVDLRQGHTFAGFVSGRTFRKRSLALWLPDDMTERDVRLSDEHVEARIVTIDQARALVLFDTMQQELDAVAALDA